jgi:predicted DNA-binding WGR domain protein
MARFYAITVMPTLFGEWALIREWGRIDYPGTLRELWYDTENEAVRERQKLLKKKEKRGYVLTSSEQTTRVIRGECFVL